MKWQFPKDIAALSRLLEPASKPLSRRRFLTGLAATAAAAVVTSRTAGVDTALAADGSDSFDLAQRWDDRRRDDWRDDRRRDRWDDRGDRWDDRRDRDRWDDRRDRWEDRDDRRRRRRRYSRREIAHRCRVDWRYRRENRHLCRRVEQGFRRGSCIDIGPITICE